MQSYLLKSRTRRSELATELFIIQVKSPMDLGTILSRVDNRQYPTVAHFIADLKLISKGMEEYWGDDPQGLPEISRAKALEDQTTEALSRRIPTELSEKCKAIHAKGGPTPPPVGGHHRFISSPGFVDF